LGGREKLGLGGREWVGLGGSAIDVRVTVLGGGTGCEDTGGLGPGGGENVGLGGRENVGLGGAEKEWLGLGGRENVGLGGALETGGGGTAWTVSAKAMAAAMAVNFIFSFGFLGFEVVVLAQGYSVRVSNNIDFGQYLYVFQHARCI